MLSPPTQSLLDQYTSAVARYHRAQYSSREEAEAETELHKVKDKLINHLAHLEALSPAPSAAEERVD